MFAFLAGLVVCSGLALTARPSRRRRASPLASAAALHDDDDSSEVIVTFAERYLSAIDEAIECAVPSALCDIAACTLNTDNRTATCGCQSMPADAGNPGVLRLGWGSMILSGSAIYRDTIAACVDSGNCSKADFDVLCIALQEGTLWSGLADARNASTTYSTSLYSTNPLTANASHDPSEGSSASVVCDDAMCASCMSAPCYDVRYGSGGDDDDNGDVFDLSCVCPVLAGYECGYAHVESKNDGDLCKEISASHAPSCAASTGDIYNTTSFSGHDVVRYIDAIKTAGAHQGDSAQCPSYGARSPIYDGQVSSTKTATTDER